MLNKREIVWFGFRIILLVTLIWIIIVGINSYLNQNIVFQDTFSFNESYTYGDERIIGMKTFGSILYDRNINLYIHSEPIKFIYDDFKIEGSIKRAFTSENGAILIFTEENPDNFKFARAIGIVTIKYQIKKQNLKES